jgi:polar amino acid transport system substrate-binding protein
VSTDPPYPPQSSLNEETGAYEVFDIDAATEIAKRLGIEIAREAPSWDTIISGNWNGRWDISVGSMTITPERSEVVWFTPPYSYTPAAFAVHEDNTTITDATNLSGKRVGVCGGCTYDTYLQRTLEIAQDASGTPEAIESVVTDPEIVTYDTDSTAIAVQAGLRPAPTSAGCGPRAPGRQPRGPVRARSGRGRPGRTRAR